MNSDGHSMNANTLNWRGLKSSNDLFIRQLCLDYAVTMHQPYYNFAITLL